MKNEIEKQQRKNQGAFYTKLNVTAMMWEMIQKHINIDDYIIWDTCCGTGNLFKDTNNEIFDFLNKDRLFLSDIDETAVRVCKQDKDFNASNVFGFNYQNTVVDNFVGMPSELKKVIKETPEKLFVVCNPPYLGGSMVRLEGAYEIIYGTLYQYAKANGWLGYKSNDIFQQCYKQFMVWCNEKQIKQAKKCYIVPISWITAVGCGNTGEVFRKKLDQNFFDAFIVSNCEFENVGRFDPIGVFLVGNDKGEYSWKNIKIPVIFPENEKHKARFEKEMNKINAKYNLKKQLPKLQFKFEKKFVEEIKNE